ncbi:venom carboxylesterase-6-like [Vanessa cardui]|uniref:venom carboxylesterase-6-like n=1 Tax=Vanessa cardui TaxID=171605 RepID=UPI001F140C72|nr:venom carboxylesterase-6-like [Vanessa cardui]
MRTRAMANMWFLISICSAIICGVLSQSNNINLPKVNISQGTVVGSVSDDDTYYEFYGIPYADSTAGSNRFKAPTAPPSFEDEFIANRRDIKCIKASGAGYEGTEDCLTVNVFTPTLNDSRQLPVMVWIKGKEFDNVNDADLSFKRFMEKEVIIVHINYRESILGFLCLGTESAPGNAGLKDIIAGLKWIQNNIAAFGGNPDNVSLFGHGSGAAAVDLITLTQSAKGLVHRAISQSGSALAPWAVTRNNLRYAIIVAEALGHKINDLDTLSDVFSRTSVAALMAVINELDLTDNSLAFAPCIERSIENVEPLLLKSPYQTIIEGEQLQIPFMTGFVDVEGSLRADKVVNSDWLERIETAFVDFIQPDLDFLSEEEELEIAQEIQDFYFRNDTTDDDVVNDFLTYQGDTMILISAIREARMRTASSNSSVYLYQFSYKGELSEALNRPIPINAAGHGEELLYLFNKENDTGVSSHDQTISNILIERWTNFAKNSIPTSETSEVAWHPYTSTSSNYLRVLDDGEINESGNSNFEVELVSPHPTTLVFWDSIYSQHFIDAESKWNLNDRAEDGEDTVDEEEDGNDNVDEEEDGNDNVDEGEDGNDNVDDDNNTEGEEDNDDSVPDSASTAVGYTFAILTLFALLDKFHNMQILS